VITGCLVAALVAILAHELGHAVSARWLKIPILEIGWGYGRILWRWQIHPADMTISLRIWPWGTFVAIDGPSLARLSRGRQLFQHASGILTNFVVAGIATGMPAQIVSAIPDGSSLRFWLVLMNGVLALANLIPVGPTDGYHLLKAWRQPFARS